MSKFALQVAISEYQMRNRFIYEFSKEYTNRTLCASAEGSYSEERSGFGKFCCRGFGFGLGEAKTVNLVSKLLAEQVSLSCFSCKAKYSLVHGNVTSSCNLNDL